MTTLISFLGKGKADPNTGYRRARYRFADGVVREEPFFGMGLMAMLRPQKLVLVGTVGSMWGVFFEHQQHDDEQVLALMDAVDEQRVTPELLSQHEQQLSHRYGIEVRCLLIPFARDEVEQAAILTALAAAIDEDEKVMLDVTHGFRHLPMLALVAARYLKHVRGVQVSDVYYGAADMTDPVTGLTPVLHLGGMLKMLDWVEALAVYEKSGHYGGFAELLAQDGMAPPQAQMLADAAYFERSSNPLQAAQKLTGAYRAVADHAGRMGSLFREALSKHIGWFSTGGRANWELALADRYLKRQDYLRAITYLYEGYVSCAVEQEGGNRAQFGDREAAITGRWDNDDVKLLRRLRNAMAHGVRSDHVEVRALLQDQAKLDQKLRILRKSLFN